MSHKNDKLHWLDYMVFILVLLTTIVVGIYFALTGGKQKTTKEYFSGHLGVFPASLSIVVSFMSAAMVIGVPAEAYLYGGQYYVAIIGTGVGTLFASVVFVPVFHRIKLISVNKYLEMRYKSNLTKYIATCQSVMLSVVYSAIVIFAPCSAISTLTDIPVWAIILMSSVVSIFYTSIGGIKAVIWTDTFLCFCMLAGMLLVSIQGILMSGGIAEAWRLSSEGGRLNIFNFDPNPAVRLTFWNLIFGVAFDTSGTYGFGQATVMRYTNAETLRKAQLTVLFSIFGNMLMYLLPVTAGLAIYAYYARIGCDPLKSGIIDGPNQLVPHFVMETLNYPGVPGIFLASMFAGALSSVSSALNSAAANIWDDLLERKAPKSISKKGSFMSKIIVILLGCVSTLLCYLAIFFGGTVYQLSYSLVSTVLVPLSGMFYLGLLFPWINDKGVIGGGFIGFVFILWICMGQFYTETYSSLILPTDISNCSQTSSPVMNDTHFTMFTTSKYSDIVPTTVFDTIWHNTTSNDGNGSNVVDGGFLTWLYSISYLWYRLLGIAVMFIAASIISLFTGRNKLSDTDEQLLCCCYGRCASGELKDSRSWTEDEFYSVKKTTPEADSFL